VTVTLRVVLDQLVAPTSRDLAEASASLTEALIATAPRGCDVGAIVPSPGIPDDEAIAGLSSETRLSMRRRELAASWQLGVAPGIGKGLIHSPTPLAPLVRHDRVNETHQIVVTVWDLRAWETPEELPKAEVLAARALLSRVGKHADAVIVPTHAMAERLAEVAKAKLVKKVRVINGAPAAGLRVPSDAVGRLRALDLPQTFVAAAGGSAASDALGAAFAAVVASGWPSSPRAPGSTGRGGRSTPSRWVSPSPPSTPRCCTKCSPTPPPSRPPTSSVPPSSVPWARTPSDCGSWPATAPRASRGEPRPSGCGRCTRSCEADGGFYYGSMQRSRLRGLIRRLREARGTGALVRAIDRVWWFRVISASSLVDTEYYAAQLGLRRVPASLAIAHYVSRGFRRGMSLNPLFDDVVAGWELPEVTRVPALYAYLVNERETISIHPWWDAVAYGAEHGGPGLETAWARRDEQLQLGAAGHEWTLTVAEIRRRAIAAAHQWRRGTRTHQTAPPRDIALVRIVQAHDRRYVRKLVQVARRVDECDVLLPLIDVDASQWVSTALLADLVPGVRVSGHRRGTSWRSVVAAAVQNLSASTVVVLDPRAEFADSQLDALITQASAGAAVCAAHRAADGTIDAVGAADVGGQRPYALLSGLPGDDLTGLPETVDVPLLSGRTFAMPSAVLRRAIDGVDDAEPDALSAISRTVRDALPLKALPGVSPVLDEPAFAFAPKRAAHRPARRADERDRSRAEAVLEGAGFRVERWVEAGQGRVEPVLSWIRPHPDARRWAVKMCAPAGKQGAVWGDAHFARGLANALRRLGHTVVVDAYDARARSTTVVDDVSVAIRGPYEFEATSTGVNLEWIISHPDSLTRDEVAGFDRVFAASHGWAERAGRRWGLEIETLLPCTDTDVFHPRGLPRDEDIVFVGKTRGAARPSVVEPVKAGIPVRVYGPDWAHFVPASSIAAKSIPHERLAERYETASIVLNDQWPDMQREGFMTLRPFDVVAVEGRLVSEPVEGLEDLFEGAVVTYRDTEHLVEMLSGPADDLFPDADRLRRIAARVREEHSFDARAVVLDRAAREIAARGR